MTLVFTGTVRHKYAANLCMTAIDRKKLDPDLKSNLDPTILVCPVLDPQHSSAKSSSVEKKTSSDPDPDWIRIQLGKRIRIQAGQNCPSVGV
jgi:hypothetical protein